MKTVIEIRKRTVTKKVTDELNGIRELLSKFPTGIFSMVSDTFDLWRVCTEYVTVLKDEILARDGKLVIRPDSGDPVDILCGSYSVEKDGILVPSGNGYNSESGWKSSDYLTRPEVKGVIELLWDVFGGTINEQGYKVLDPHIGAIYGDSITIDRADEICRRLESKGFASTNVVLGIGSFTYQYNTRDTFGFAMKATYVEVLTPIEGKSKEEWLFEGREIFKDPITDDGMKKSAKGLMQVYRIDGSHGKSFYQLKDQVSWEEEGKGDLRTLYLNGEFHNVTTLSKIKDTLLRARG